MESRTRLMRDLAAGISAALLLAVLLLGTRSVGGEAGGGQSGSPDLGTWARGPEPKGPPVPTSDKLKTPSGHEQARPKPPVEPVKPRPPATPRQTAQTKVAAPPEPSPAPAPKAAPDAEGDRVPSPPEARPPALAPEPAQLQPTPVEPRPTRVADMSSEEIRQAIGDYQGYLRRGRMRVRVDHSLLSPEQLRAIAAYYVLNTANSQVFVDQTGRQVDPGTVRLPSNGLEGDVPRRKWPAMLERSAEQLFAGGHEASAAFQFTDECILRTFRALAPAVGTGPVPPGSEFLVQVYPDRQGQIDVKLVESKLAREGEPLR